MGKAIDVAVGQFIPLQVQETAKDGTKVIRATLYDLGTGTVIASNVLLAHTGDGFYRNTAQVMPDVAYIMAQYQVFDADGLTPNTTGDKAVSDVFKRIDPTSIGVAQDRTLVATLAPEDSLEARISSEGESLQAKVSSDSGAISAVLLDEENTLKASLDDEGGFEAELD